MVSYVLRLVPAPFGMGYVAAFAGHGAPFWLGAPCDGGLALTNNPARAAHISSMPEACAVAARLLGLACMEGVRVKITPTHLAARLPKPSPARTQAGPRKGNPQPRASKPSVGRRSQGLR